MIEHLQKLKAIINDLETTLAQKPQFSHNNADPSICAHRNLTLVTPKNVVFCCSCGATWHQREKA